jgi:hypothetical protein
VIGPQSRVADRRDEKQEGTVRAMEWDAMARDYRYMVEWDEAPAEWSPRVRLRELEESADVR